MKLLIFFVLGLITANMLKAQQISDESLQSDTDNAEHFDRLTGIETSPRKPQEIQQGTEIPIPSITPIYTVSHESNSMNIQIPQMPKYMKMGLAMADFGLRMMVWDSKLTHLFIRKKNRG